MSTKEFENENLYVYGIIPNKEFTDNNILPLKGIDGEPINFISHKELAALTTTVNPQKFSQQNIDLLTKNLEWLQLNAFHHHSCIEELNKQFTILPLSFCTIFQNETKLIALLEDNYHQILEKLHILKGMKEWNLKVFCQMDISREYILFNNPEISKFMEKLQSMPAGKQFLMKKKLDHKISEELIMEQERWQAKIQQHLSPYSKESSIRKNWGRDITGRKEEMMFNCDFLVEVNKTEELLDAIKNLEMSFIELGCSFEVTGPWPPYHFSKMGSG